MRRDGGVASRSPRAGSATVRAAQTVGPARPESSPYQNLPYSGRFSACLVGTFPRNVRRTESPGISGKKSEGMESAHRIPAILAPLSHPPANFFVFVLAMRRSLN